MLDVIIDETNFVLVNIYNPNTETEQVTTLLDLGKMWETIKDFSHKHIALTSDFSFIFDTSLDKCGAKPALKMKSIAKLWNLKKSLICVIYGEKETLELNDILFDRSIFLV